MLSTIEDQHRTETSLQETLERLRKVTGSVIDVIVMAVESRDPYTSGHQRRVSDLSRSIASEMGLPRKLIDGIRIAGLVHDLGKIAIPAEILSTPRKLSEIEVSLIKTHSQHGYDILKEVDFDWPVAQMVYQHHERLNGSGYPQGLKGDEIILEAKIIAVADVVVGYGFPPTL
ncbi:MAG: HD-GYP domain-containing protein [Armatimonadota bacterium]